MGGTLASNTGSSRLRAYPSCPRMLQTLKELEARSSEAKATAFQHLLLLVGIHLFKVRWPGREGVTDLGSGHDRLPPERLEGFARKGSGVLNLADFLVQLVMGGAELVSTTLDPHGFFLNPHFSGGFPLSSHEALMGLLRV